MKNIETERKFLIRMPEKDVLAGASDVSYIRQTYLESDEKGVSERVRSRRRGLKTVYTHTKKCRISTISAIEKEEEISRKEYLQLLLRREPGTKTIKKKRYVLPYRGFNFEIDLYSFWRDRAVMEIEMMSEDTEVELPDTIEIIRELSGEKQYSNHSLSREIPKEDIN